MFIYGKTAGKVEGKKEREHADSVKNGEREPGPLPVTDLGLGIELKR
jgi:hypothetical protein